MKNTLFIVLVLISTCAVAQHEEKQSSFRDTLDQKMDVSSFLIDADGFIPIPQIISEPALGGIGLMLTPVFIKPNKTQIEGQYVAPNITAGFAGYTANQTWMLGVMRIASLPKYQMKYRAGMAHGNVNMNFYRALPLVGEKSFSFNFNMTPVFGSISKEIGHTNIYVGVQYFYLNVEVKPNFDFVEFPDFNEKLVTKHSLSSFGIQWEYDKRDNVFTPNKGLMINSNLRVNAPWTGSDFEYQNLTLGVLQYFQPIPQLVSGFRFDTAFQFGDAPFYTKPSIKLRGVPMSRYQGESTYTLETEQRYDFTLRWSAVVFGGLAKATSEERSFSDALLVYNYGTGFRYLIARQFGLRMGVDVALSNEDFGYYITFGSAWNNRG